MCSGSEWMSENGERKNSFIFEQRTPSIMYQSFPIFYQILLR